MQYTDVSPASKTIPRRRHLRAARSSPSTAMDFSNGRNNAGQSPYFGFKRKFEF
jgi:hypothetical protein